MSWCSASPLNPGDDGNENDKIAKVNELGYIIIIHTIIFAALVKVLIVFLQNCVTNNSDWKIMPGLGWKPAEIMDIMDITHYFVASVSFHSFSNLLEVRTGLITS